MTLLLLGVAGGLGALCRGILDSSLTARLKPTWPAGIFTVNVIGCFFFGLVTGGGVLSAWIGPYSLYVTTGFLGGFTTFSTAMTDALTLFEKHRYWACISLLLGNFILGIAAFFAGLALG